MGRRLSLAAAVVLTVASASAAAAELEVPRRNPRGRVSQHVGLTEVTVEYNSPAVRGRPIWGAIVPYGEMWQAGDSPASTITFSREVVLAGQPVPAGTYALLMLPAAAEWTLVLNKNASLGDSSRGYKRELDVVRVKARPKAAQHRERLTFLFSDFTDEQASLDLEWEKLRLSIPIKVDTREQVLAGIRGLDGLWRSYANAARYMLETKKDYDAGLTYADKSLALEETWRGLWTKASLLAAKGRFGEARDVADRAYQVGREHGDDSFPEDAVKRALAEWSRAADRQAQVPPAASPAATRAQAHAEPEGEILDDPPAPIHVEKKLLAETLPAATPTAPTTPPPVAAGSVALVEERRAPVHAPVARAGTGNGAPKAADIAPVIEKGRADIQSCYQRALRLDPTLTHAKVTISISVGVSGMVRSVALDSPQRFRAIEPCIKDAVSRWVFPLSSAEYGAELPIVLTGKD